MCLPLPAGAVCNAGLFDVVFGVVDVIGVKIDLLVSEVSAVEGIIYFVNLPCMSDNACTLNDQYICVCVKNYIYLVLEMPLVLRLTSWSLKSLQLKT